MKPKVEDRSEFTLVAVQALSGDPSRARVMLENPAGVRMSVTIPREAAAQMEVGVTKARFNFKGRGN